MIVYDWQGNVRDLAYLRGKYGGFVIQEPVAGVYPQYRIAALCEQADGEFNPVDVGRVYHTWAPAEPEAPTALVVTVLDEAGKPLPDVRVAWYWPDADVDNNAGPLAGVHDHMRSGHAVSGTTNASGMVGFGMGRGAYYFPSPERAGPHAAWVYGTRTNSALVFGLGMVAATNHYHFDVTFQRVLEEEPPPPPPPPDKWEILFDKLDTIIALMR